MTELEKSAQNGQAVGFMLIKSAEKKISVKGSPYLDLSFRTRTARFPQKCGTIRDLRTNTTPVK